MPPTLTYPGVYIYEATSPVHAITGVGTSVGAFFGQASMGLVNSPIRVQSLGDYIRNFGPPIAGGYLGQSVFQFFGNGGSDCYVIRLAKGSQSAGLMLRDLNHDDVLVISAVSQGLWGNSILLTVDYNTARPDSTFNLNVSYTSQGSVVKTESLSNLSMDPTSPRYAPAFITQSSQLITAAAPAAPPSTSITTGISQARRPICRVFCLSSSVVRRVTR